MKLFAAFVLTLLVWVVLSFAIWVRQAHAETLHNGRVYKTTADRIIADRQLVCTHGKTRFEADPQGRLVVIQGKVCTEVSGKR